MSLSQGTRLGPSEVTAVSRLDGKGYAYGYARLLSDLFIVEGLE